MKFEVIKKETVMMIPQQDMTERRISSEIRLDPLTGRTSRICHFMELQWEKPDFNALVSGTESWCPFCPDKVHTITPCFPKSLITEGRMQNNGMIIFPNIAPYDTISAVAVYRDHHFIPMTEFTPALMTSAFSFVQEFFRRIESSGHPESVYHIVNWNYMPPSGSSIIHPHLQVFSSSTAPNLMRQELEASKRYIDSHGSCFWEDLISTEMKTGERYLGQIGRSHWMTTYAPMGVAGDVLAVLEDVSCTLNMTAQDIHDISDGLSKIMAAYDKMGIYSFNMNFFTGTETDDHFRFHLLFSPRTFFSQKLGTPDVGALQFLFGESICLAYPEKIRDILKQSWVNRN